MTFDPPDFAALWQDYVRACKASIVDDADDRAHWKRFAPHYDTRGPSAYAQTLDAIAAYLRPEDAVLEIGAGTGQVTIPVARQVRHVTAIDHSPAMLALLREKAQQDGIDNIRAVEAAWENAKVEPHDVILAPWSIYRQPNIVPFLRKMLDATRRVMVIVTGGGVPYPHDDLLARIFGERPPRHPVHLYLMGLLWQIGVRAEARLIDEVRDLHGDSPAAVARLVAPIDADDARIGQLAEGLRPMLECEADGWHYRHILPACLLIWERPTTG
jgi:SAM-dependent methyltransferase